MKKTVLKRRAASLLFAASLFLVSLTGCAAKGNGSPAAEGDSERISDKKLSVVTTIFPQYDFVREIAGEEADIKMLLKPGEETHSYEPSPQDIIAIQNSDIFIYVGGENDAWVEEILESMPESDMVTLRLVDCVETVEEEHVEGMREKPGHSHGHGEDSAPADGEKEIHSVHELDEHVWTSPKNAMRIAEEICALLSGADREHADIYRKNADLYEQELKQLDKEFREVMEEAKRNLVIFGDRFPFRYFADEYGLEYYAAFPGCASDTEPSAATMAFLINKAEEEQVPAVLKMELSNENIANAIAEAAGVEVRTFYSCHNLTAEEFRAGENYLSMMRKNVETLREVLN